MQNKFLELMKKRRSFYQIGNTEVLGKNEIKTIIEEVLQTMPTPYNIQSERVVLLFGQHHKKLWDIVLETLRPLVKNNFEKTKQNIQNFASGYGSILYFVDKDSVKELETKFPLYKDNFNNWCMQANAILQFSVWTALSENNVGASLQHYNPLIDQEVKKVFNLPQNWELVAQMPFGNIIENPQAKPKLDINTKLKTFM